MKATTWLRIATGLTLFQAVGHTFGAVLAGPTQGESEIALQSAMKSYVVSAMGMQRTYWDFYFGYGWTISAMLLCLTLIMWFSVRLAREAPALARPIVGSLAVGYAGVAVACSLFFVTAPIVVAILIVLALLAAWGSLRTV